MGIVGLSHMTAERIFLPHLAGPLANYPHAKRVGNAIYLSGLSARQPDGSVRGVTKAPDGTVIRDIREQTIGVIETMKAILESVGSSLANLVDLTVFLTSMEDYAGFNDTYNRYFEGGSGPARTTVGVRELPGNDLIIEIKGVAYL